MANHCQYCDTRRPQPTERFSSGTKIMVLGTDWFEFCESCGDDKKYSLTNSETGEQKTLDEVFESLPKKDN
jgi:hypothetical protein